MRIDVFTQPWRLAFLAGLLAAVAPALVIAQQPAGSPLPGDAANQPVPSPASAPALAQTGLNNPRPTFLAYVAVDHADGVYHEGQTIAVRFVSERAARLYLLYHQADGRCLLLFPNAARPDNQIPARAAVEVPAPGEPFRFRVRAPFGTELFQVLAVTEPVSELDRLAASRQAAIVPAELLAAVQDRLTSNGVPWAEHRVPIRTLPFSEQAPSRPPARAGLFIGIGRYKDPRLAPTHEELRHSAELMHERMCKRGGLDAAHTKLVVDEQATRANLETLITHWLPSVTQPGDTVFVYFSGHAGQFENRDGTEPDGMDEALGPYDLDIGPPTLSATEHMERYRASAILDDTLARWLEELAGRQVVLILDTCHSGGVVQGKGLSRFFDDESTRIKDIAQLNIAVLTSCASDEQALFEGTPDKTMWFTHFLAEAVETLPAPVTVPAAYEYCRQGIKLMLERRHEARDQEPTLTDRMLLPVALVP